MIGEELGLVGATVILLCFCLIAWRGLRVAGRAPDSFGGLLAIGLTTMIAAQALVNISVVLGLLPTKGIPLPFISAGGSSLAGADDRPRNPAEHLAAGLRGQLTWNHRACLGERGTSTSWASAASA